MLLKPTSRISSGSEPNLRTVTSVGLFHGEAALAAEIWARPPKRVAWMVGADMTWSSRTMANCSP